ncbi:MAG TPA: hypothetical protein VIF34_00975 [Methylocystis sp.]|jgi:hypothetical protein
MRLIKYPLVLLAAAGALTAAPTAKAGPNVEVCLYLSNQYNNCMNEAAGENRRGARYGGGWGGGYGPGWGDGWDPERDYYRRQRAQARSQAKQTECARWLYAIQQNNCVR